MSYMQEVVAKALKNNPNFSNEDAEKWSAGVKSHIDFINLDSENRSLVAKELGATPEQFLGFLEIVKALWNSRKVGNDEYMQGFVPEQVRKKFQDCGLLSLLEDSL